MRSLAVLSFALLLVACAKKPTGSQPDGKAEAASAATNPESDVAKAPEPAPRSVRRMTKADAMATPLHGDSPQLKDVAAAEYPEAGIDAIDPSCTKPWVVVQWWKGDHKSDTEVVTVGQALQANRAFLVTDAEPRSAGELTVEIHSKDGATGILARCHDAGTCTRLAAMIKAATKWDAPKTGCGDLPYGLSPSTRLGHPVMPAMPREGDTRGLCARLGACKLAKEPTSSEDPIGACQKSPSSFPITCALKPTCEDVLTCR